MLALLRGNGIGDFLPGLGYAGIVVAVLAALSPLAVVFAALFVGAVLTGVESMSTAVGLPTSLADAAIGLMLIMALIGDALVRYRVRWIRAGTVSA
jgi:simple sugar transport system permease protein